jgi:cyclic beta-1,2-glucan synthetase
LFLETVDTLRGWLGIHAGPRFEEGEPPLRAELLSTVELEKHGRALAGEHELEMRRGRERLLRRLAENERVIRDAYAVVDATVGAGKAATPAGQWLLENYYLIEEQIELARSHLPRGYSVDLPTVRRGAIRGVPRVYDLASELVSHSDGVVDAGNLTALVRAYQSQTPLRLGELWAIPIMLRLTLIENLRRVAYRITWRSRHRDLAVKWAGRLTEAAREEPRLVMKKLADFVRAEPPLATPFISELAVNLEGAHPAIGLAIQWIAQMLAETGQSLEAIQQAESQQQAADQISIANSVTSLRELSAIDWRQFVAELSVTEAALRQDPAGVYEAMDFHTKDRYRHAVEWLARRTRRPEEWVAEAAVKLAEARRQDPECREREAHVGYFLVDRGRRELERSIGCRGRFCEGLRARPGRAVFWLYLAGMAALLALASAPVVHLLAAESSAPGAALWAMAGVLVLAASRTAVSIWNWIVTRGVGPRILGRMDFSEGIPDAHRSAVVVPTLLASPEQVDGLLESLERHSLANRVSNLRFGLLTDFVDAGAEHHVDDAALLERARRGIRRLNRQYAEPGPPRFFWLHRPRVWNAGEGVWMGKERKRGKLEEFNQLLLAGDASAFSVVEADLEDLRSLRYVITLDSDTQLPPESAWKLVGTMAHPLNRAEVDPATGCVIRGHGVLQPRLAVSLPSAQRSPFSACFAGDVGLDPYTREVSNIYHDLFGEGQYVGKGIYEVRAFSAAAGRRFPPNRILSHDLVEGCHARCGFVGDVELIEETPARYLAAAQRRHRWTRGDWQAARWIMPSVPGPDGLARRNPLNALSRWLLFDTLRRSLLPPAWLAAFAFALAMPSGAVGVWLAALLALFLAPDAVRLAGAVLNKDRNTAWRGHAARLAGSERLAWMVTAMEFAFLPHQTAVQLDAISRVFWRLGFSHKRLLQWRTAAAAERAARSGIAATCAAMWAAPATGAALAAAAWLVHGLAAWPMIALALVWFISPALAWLVSRPRTAPPSGLSQRDTRFLHRVARRTWMYFDRFTGPEDNWLPPDNFQEGPEPVLAHRTSPTNIGFGLLSILAAYDFGYLTAGECLRRAELMLETLERLPRYRGHFFNWYDTRTLAPLHPRYVSTVDSGNLAIALIVARRGLEELADAPPLPPRWRVGLRDTAEVLREALAAARPGEAPAELAATVERHIAELDAVAENPAAIAGWVRRAGEELGRGGTAEDLPEEVATWLQALRDQYRALAEEAALPDSGRAGQRRRIEDLAERCEELVEMDFGFLYDRSRHLLALGFNCENHRRDSGYYDLLASEARLSSYFGVARGLLPVEHWFHLGRQMAPGVRHPVLVSWSGSMFEYLMPRLFMPTFPGTLLHRSDEAAVRRQIRYAASRGIPWGISESCYHQVDASRTFQYRAFGVPDMGLKRGLAEELVVAPYASVMALMVAPREACANLRSMARRGWLGPFGFYEAVDFTPGRVPEKEPCAVVPCYMAHHGGMSLLGLASTLLGQPMQRRFMADPSFRAASLLLQERIPATQPRARSAAGEIPKRRRAPGAAVARTIRTPSTPFPEVHVLSNGRYQVMLTNAGSGFSRWQDLALTRWREDAARDNWGLFVYLRDADSGAVWSAAFQPVRPKFEQYEVVFSQGGADIRALCHDVDARTRIAVSPEDDVEVRRIELTNTSGRTRTLEVTTYAEIVLGDPRGEASHPLFNGLFVETEVLAERESLVARRRPRSPEERWPWLFHTLLVRGGEGADRPSFETDRERFLGRNRGPDRPAAIDRGGPLGGSAGPVIDPAFAIRRRLTIRPGKSAVLYAVLGVAPDRAGAQTLIHRYRDHRLAERVFDLAWTHSQVRLHQIGARQSDARLFARMVNSLLFANPRQRAGAASLARNRRGQSGLWSYGISGDLPLVLVRVSDAANLDLVRQMIQAQCYWRTKGLKTELVIWAEGSVGYRQTLLDEILGLIQGSAEARMLDQPGGIFVRGIELVPEEDRLLMLAIARLVISDRRGSLAEQVGRGLAAEPKLPHELLPPKKTPLAVGEMRLPPRDLLFFNGRGGFTPDGREYVVLLPPGASTPAPWANVLANPGFGSVVTETGSAYTWAENAHEFRLTPWYNDPVRDPTGEAFYIRDEETRRLWSPSPGPARGRTPYVARHGLGYSVFEHTEQGLASEMTTYVSVTDPVKFTVISVRNLSNRRRRLRVSGYCEWVLGDLRERHAMNVVSRLDPQTGALLARNSINHDFGDRTAFFYCSQAERSLTSDRIEFLGRNGTLAAPAGLRRAGLSNRVVSGRDACAAFEAPLGLPPGGNAQVVFILGSAASEEEARALLRKCGGTGAARAALEEVWQFWKHTTGAVYAETPDPAVNVLVNHWLPYQVLASRYWGRSGFHQSGGAYGFRDQLQDSLALLWNCPWLAREHLLRAAARQFPEGDVQHWWHPPTGRGVRTRVSDDYLWLPYVAARYVEFTGDAGVLDEEVPFLHGRRLAPGEESSYELPHVADQRASLYRHCELAIRNGLRFGTHGLPLIGCGDWNDGMNRIGREGRGESVWLGFFLFDVLTRFAPLAERRGETAFARECRRAADQLRESIEAYAWDGRWYLRAFTDDGEAIGSRAAAECRVDLLPQSWAVLSGAAPPAMAAAALDAALAELVDEEHGIVRIFKPPFDRSGDPGYIKGYVPGVRENGGQYTHAAVWAAMAVAKLGRAAEAWRLLHMLSPIAHSDTPEKAARYRGEPYVMPADVYSAKGHEGRAGWTWYTGSAGWLYQLLVRQLLGLNIEADRLRLAPLLPPGWNEFTLHYRYRETFYHIRVVKTGDESTAVRRVLVDGQEQPDRTVVLVDDRRERHVEVEVG